jgi:hypothetical protein
MAEMKVGALPALPTGLSVADPEVRQQYNESIQKVLSALENRSQIPWFKLSAAMADPGRTGSAMEGFGRAMGVMGKQQEEERARELPVAQMRAQLAGQQYEMSKEEKALNAFAAALGTTPQNIQAGMLGAVNNPAMMQRINAAMPQFYGSPKIMEMAKTLFGQHKDISQFLLEERKAGMTEADLVAKYGKEILPMIRGYGNVQGTGTTRPQAGAPQAGAPQAGGQTTNAPTTGQRDPNLVYNERGEVIDVLAQPDPDARAPTIQGQPIVRPADGERATGETAPAAPIRTASEALGPLRVEDNRVISPTGEILAERGQAGLAEWNRMKDAARDEYNRRKADDIKFERERISKAGEQRDATVESRLKEVGAINTDEIGRTQGLLQSFGEIVKDPEMAGAFALMMKQGIGPALYELAKDSVRVGNTTISVDAYRALIKQLPPKVQEKLRGAEMLLSELFIQKAREAKSAFGPSISNFDILMQKERMASIRDTPKLINNWITQELAMTEQKREIAEAYADFLKSASGTNRKPAEFFASKEYKDLSKKYTQIYKDLAIISYGAPQ